MKPIGQPCVAGIVFAVAVEADAFERHAERHTETRAAGLVIHEGFVAGRRIAWSVGGVGAAAAARATQECRRNPSCGPHPSRTVRG